MGVSRILDLGDLLGVVVGGGATGTTATSKPQGLSLISRLIRAICGFVESILTKSPTGSTPESLLGGILGGVTGTIVGALTGSGLAGHGSALPTGTSGNSAAGIIGGLLGGIASPVASAVGAIASALPSALRTLYGTEVAGFFVDDYVEAGT